MNEYNNLNRIDDACLLILKNISDVRESCYNLSKEVNQESIDKLENQLNKVDDSFEHLKNTLYLFIKNSIHKEDSDEIPAIKNEFGYKI